MGYVDSQCLLSNPVSMFFLIESFRAIHLLNRSRLYVRNARREVSVTHHHRNASKPLLCHRHAPNIGTHRRTDPLRLHRWKIHRRTHKSMSRIPIPDIPQSYDLEGQDCSHSFQFSRIQCTNSHAPHRDKPKRRLRHRFSSSPSFLPPIPACTVEVAV